jgi:uncharacterized membrane protein YbhN (UPF0104 family)
VETLAEPETEEVAEVTTAVGILYFLARTLGPPIPFLFFVSTVAVTFLAVTFFFSP